jgi:ribonuclease MRP protein subunit RMP1
MTALWQQAHGNPTGGDEDPTALKTAAATSLAYVLPVLDAFNHRHKNQHSATHWWSSFSLLRRRSRELATVLQRELDASRIRAIGLSGSGSSGGSLSSISNKKKSLLLNRPGVDRDGSAAVARARLISRQLIPRCYVYVSSPNGSL